MSGKNTTHKIYLKVLTPVHIGGAQEKDLQEGLDYIQFEDGETWQLDWEKVYKRFTPDEVSEAIINKKLIDLVENDIEDVAFQIEQSFGDTKVIKSFIRDGFGRAYIPGSSIKGAMKNWLYSAYDTNSRGTRNLLGSFETDLFRFIKPSDCYFNDEVMNYPTKTFNLRKVGNNWEGGWKHALHNNTRSDFSNKGFVTDYECFQPDQQGSFSLSITSELSTNFRDVLYNNEIEILSRKLQNEKIEERRKKLVTQIAILKNGKSACERFYSSSPFNELFSCVNTQVKIHLHRELEFFNKYKQAKDSNEIVSSYQNLVELANQLKPDQCILRLSAGSGFHGITGDFQFQDHTNTGEWNGRMKFKSRKIAFTANAMYPMGFVLLSATPFSEEDNTSVIKSSEMSSALSKEITVKTKQIAVETKDASNLKHGDEVYAEVLEIGKPFALAKLFVENYSFEFEVPLSGIKNSGLAVGDKIKCEINSMAKGGKISMVKYSSKV